MKMTRDAWWRGSKGEWYVVIQFALFLLIIFGPRHVDAWPSWPVSLAGGASAVGGVLLGLGCVACLLAVFHLGSNLTPLPHPRAGARLVMSGMYRFVRHPIYFGVILMALGFAMWVQGSLTLLEALVLALFLDIKSRREERWLVAHFADYPDYRQRVKKLLPFIY